MSAHPTLVPSRTINDELVPLCAHTHSCGHPGKVPHEKGWQTRRFDAAQLASADNLGLRTRYFITPDIDVDDPAIAAAIEVVARDVLGPAPRRWRENSSRSALLYRLDEAEEPFKKAKIKFKLPTGAAAQVEVLADGQQTVIRGTHHTGVKIKWEGHPSEEALSPVTVKQRDAFLAAVRKRLVELGCTIEQDKSGDEPETVPAAAVKGADPHARADARSYLAAALERVRAAKVGERNETLNALAYGCYQRAAKPAKLLTTEEIETEFTRVGLEIGLTLSDIKATLKSARKGLRKPITDKLAAVAGEREQIEWNLLDFDGMTRRIEERLVKAGGLYRIGDVYVAVREADLPGTEHPDDPRLPAPKQLLTVPMSRTDLRFAIEPHACIIRQRAKGGPVAELPEEVIEHMLKRPEKHAPQIFGLAQHPLVTPEGRLLNTEGYDDGSGLYVSLGGWRFPEVKARPTKDDAVRAAKRLRTLLFEEVLLQDKKIDGAALLALYLTGVGRKTLAQAPAGLINATMQGTGKTTAARVLHVVLTGRDMAVQVASTDKAERKKAIFSTLLRQPAMVVFDNVPDGETLDDAVLAPILTSPQYTDRFLGLHKDVTVLTNTLFLFTGNTITVCPDLTRRMVKVDLRSQVSRPEQRSFKNPDVVAYARSIRAEVIGYILTIQRAWQCGGRERPETQSFGLGPEFDRLVTWPLAFAGEEGLFEKREELSAQSPQEMARTRVLLALAGVFGVAKDDGLRKCEFSAMDCIRTMGGDHPPSNNPESPRLALRDAIEEVDRKKVFSGTALGIFLAQMVDQPPRNGLVLRGETVHGSARYRVAGLRAKAPVAEPSTVKGQS